MMSMEYIPSEEAQINRVKNLERMTNISNSFASACHHLPKKYTISTLQSVDITDNQDSYGRILKFSRFQSVKKERRVYAS